MQEYFSFSRRDRVAIIILSALILVIFFLPGFISPAGRKSIEIPDPGWIAAMQKLERKEEDQGAVYPGQGFEARNYPGIEKKPGYGSSPGKAVLFYFDPNSLDPAGWQKLGLRPKTIQTIQNYLSRGGQFRKPEDLQRVYGLFPDEYQRLAPFIRIEHKPLAEAKEKKYEVTVREKEYRPLIIELNTTDTTDLIALPGIGSKLAARIIAFRNKLGGFYDVKQVAETFGLTDSTYQKIKSRLRADPGEIRKIRLNTVTLEELKTHPYIRFALAQTIIAYRNEHGPFTRAEDLKKILVITEEVYSKLAPYLSAE